MSDEHDPLDALFEEPKQPGQEAGEGAADTGAQGGDTSGDDPNKGGLKAEPEAPAADAAKPEPKMVPIEALHEARKRAQDAEDRLAALPKAAVETADEGQDDVLTKLFGARPNPKEDLEGYLAYNENVQGFQLLNQTFNVSERMARKEHGGELVDKVREWGLKKFETDPAFTEKVMGDPDPFDVAIRLYNEEQKAEKLRALPAEVQDGLDADELELIRQHRAAKGGAAESGVQQTQPRGDNGQFSAPAKRSPQAPSGSIASSRGAGKASDPMSRASGPGVAIDDAFGPG